MATRSNSSRERILECSESLILAKGFAATSIDEILDKAAITKGGFFYHFDGKAGLARALVERYLEQDKELFETLFAQADNLSEDPLHQLLIFLKLLSEKMGKLKEAHPGCLVVSFTYESQQFDEEIRERIKYGLTRWRDIIAGRLNAISQKYTANEDISMDTVADMFTSSIEGGIILSRAFQDNSLLVNQLLGYRNYIRLLFDA